jgi:hypothetical protein
VDLWTIYPLSQLSDPIVFDYPAYPVGHLEEPANWSNSDAL